MDLSKLDMMFKNLEQDQITIAKGLFFNLVNVGMIAVIAACAFIWFKLHSYENKNAKW